MNIPLYAISSSWMEGKQNCKGYLQIDYQISFVSDKMDATLFKSKVLAYGWMIKAKVMYKTYKFNVIAL